MQKSKNTPAFLRYFAARFQPFTRPVFWVSIGTLLIAGAAIYQYWQHPELLETTAENSEGSSSINTSNLPNRSTAETPSRSENLGTVNLLLDELEQNKTLENISSENGLSNSTQFKKEESSFSRLQQERKAQATNSSPSETNIPEANPYIAGVGTSRDKTIELLKPSVLNRNKSNQNFYTKGAENNNSVRNDIIPNPVGNTYLSHRKKLPLANISVGAPVAGGSNNNSIPTLNNNAVPNSSEYNNPNAPFDPNLPAGANPGGEPIATTVNPNLPRSASSAIRSAQTPAAPIINSAAPSTATDTNSTNPYGTPYGASGNPVNGLPNNSVNGVENGTNGVGNPGINTFAQPTPRSFTPGVTTGINQIRRETFGNSTVAEEDPNSLQNNYNNSQLISPNYNRSAPGGFQLQPRGFSQNSFGQNSTLNPANGVESNGADSNPTNVNAPITRPVGTPSLQPSGVFRTSELQR